MAQSRKARGNSQPKRKMRLLNTAARGRGNGAAHDVVVVRKAAGPTPYRYTDELETDAERQGGGDDDLRRNPGIGASKGTTMAGADPDLIEEDLDDGANTFEGDVENDATLGGGADPRRTGRHNR
jgi:hypothetical protein